MRRMLVSRSSLLNPNPLLRLVRTSSPSRISTRLPYSCSFPIMALARVDLPAPDKPVNHNVNPRCIVNVLLPEIACESIGEWGSDASTLQCQTWEQGHGHRCCL